ELVGRSAARASRSLIAAPLSTPWGWRARCARVAGLHATDVARRLSRSSGSRVSARRRRRTGGAIRSAAADRPRGERSTPSGAGSENGRMDKVIEAIEQGRAAIAISGSLLRDPEVMLALSNRASLSPMALAGPAVAPLVPVGEQ